MKKLFLINDSTENKISYYLLAAFLIALPFNHFYSEWLFIIFCLHTAIYISKKSFQRLKDRRIWVIGSPLLLGIVALSYSGFRSEGLTNVFQQIAFVLFPIVLTLSNLNLQKYKYKLLELFATTCLLTVIYLFYEACKVIIYFHLPLASIIRRSLLNQNFTAPIDVHPTYLSMYVLLSLCIFVDLFFREGARKIRYIIYCAVLLAGLVQLSARAPFLIAEIIFIILIPVFFLQGKKKIVFSAIACFASLLFFIGILQSDSLKKRYLTDLKNDLSDYQDPGDLTESRFMRWNLEWQLVEKSPLVGYGTGSEKNILKQKYFDNKFYRSFLLGLNAHNQYLSFILNAGVVGLLLYLYILIYGLSAGIKAKDFLTVCFILILLIVSLSENILGLSKGVLFYSFFFPLLLFTIREKTPPLHKIKISGATLA